MAMDFFSAAADPSQPILHNDRPQENASDDFAGAIAHRFGSGALLTARLTPSVATALRALRVPSPLQFSQPGPQPTAGFSLLF